MNNRKAIEILKQSNKELAGHIEQLKSAIACIENGEMLEQNYWLLNEGYYSIGYCQIEYDAVAMAISALEREEQY